MQVGGQLSQDTSKYMSFQKLLPCKHARQSMQVLNVHLTLDTNSVAGFQLSNFNTSSVQLLITTENKSVEYFVRIQTSRWSSCVHISSVYSWCGSAFCFNSEF